jgi:CBS domain containing-hemolysin-like protein
MHIFYLILVIITFILLLLVAAVRPMRSKSSMFELERRSKIGDGDAKLILAREKLFSDVVSLQRTVAALLQVGVAILSILAFGWLIGVAVALLVALSYESIARFAFLKFISRRIYDRIEKAILHFIRKHSRTIKLFRGAPMSNSSHDLRIESLEELQRLVAESDNVLADDDKKLIVNSLTFNSQIVRTIMTPRRMIVSINKSEFLGPLMLNDLHKVGHNKLPVVASDLNHIIGILDLKSLLTLDTKRSTTAERAMEPKVYYINEKQTLSQALATFLRVHCSILIIVNKAKETVGLLTLEDIIEALFGRRIIDEFDDHDDLHAVAMRKGD